VPANEWNCDFVCFTDDPDFSTNGWKKILVLAEGQNTAVLNRHYKMLPHRYFSEYQYSLYLDGNIDIVGDPSSLVCKYLVNSKIAMPPHPKRNCSYEEAAHCIKCGLSLSDETERQMAQYASEGFPRQTGLTENGVMLRTHNEPEIIRLMESWWNEYVTKVKRDQISLPYLAWKLGINISRLNEGPRVSNKYFHIGLHDSDNRTSWLSLIARYAHGNQDRRWLYALITKFVSMAIRVRSFLKSRKRSTRSTDAQKNKQ
jgi:hypothetical protein